MTQIIGLTGGIGSGKSTVANLFHSLGVPLIDTDVIAHQLSQPGNAGAAAVSALFGADYLAPDGAIDRAKLRALVFADPAARTILEGALHPLIRQQVGTELAALPSHTPYCLLVVPLLFETGSYKDIVHQSWVVDCSEEQQIARVMARSHLDRAQAESIMASQIGRAARLAQADAVIDNSGDTQQLLTQVKVLHSKTLQAYEFAHKTC